MLWQPRWENVCTKLLECDENYVFEIIAGSNLEWEDAGFICVCPTRWEFSGHSGLSANATKHRSTCSAYSGKISESMMICVSVICKLAPDVQLGFGVFNEHSVHLLFYFCRVLWTGSWNCGHLMSCIPNLGQHLVGASKPWSFNVMASQRQRFIIRSLLLLEQHSYWSQMLRGMPSMQFTWSLEHLLFTPGWTTWLSSRWHTPSSALQLRMMWSSIKLARAAFKCFVCKHKQSNNTHLRCHNAFPCHVMTCNPKAPIPVPPSRPWYHHHRHKCPWQTQMPTTLGFHQECQ